MPKAKVKKNFHNGHKITRICFLMNVLTLNYLTISILWSDKLVYTKEMVFKIKMESQIHIRRIKFI
jgi:hypothetical protein